MIKSSVQEEYRIELDSGLEGPEWALVQRIVASPAFVRSPFLTNFLLYVCNRQLRGREQEITEYQIGINALGRPHSFHTGEDNIVRNYARHLRRKLSEYFDNEGSLEELTIDIPKGHYRPVFRHRSTLDPIVSPEVVPANADADVSIGSESASEPSPRHQKIHQRNPILWLAVSLALGALIAVSTVLSLRSHRAQINGGMDPLWGPFWSGDPPLVIFSNAVFLGNSKDGLRTSSISDALQAGPAGYNDTYTGIGEVNSVYELTRLFEDHQATFTLKRSLLVTWDEARRRNLIFIGAVAENPALREIAVNPDFIHVSGDGFSGIANLHPRPGERTLFSRTEHPLSEDYAVLALMPGLEPGRKILTFSGLTTFGTQAAVEFACRHEGAAQLLQATRGSDGSIRPFEAVIETKIAGGVPVQTRLVAIHTH